MEKTRLEATFSDVMVEVAIPKEFERSTRPPSRVWLSKHFLAMLFTFGHSPRLTVNRCERQPGGNWKDGITWDELMSVKAACGFADAWAVEVYPPEAEVVNDANMRHLWILDGAPPFAWSTGGGQ